MICNKEFYVLFASFFYFYREKVFALMIVCVENVCHFLICKLHIKCGNFFARQIGCFTVKIEMKVQMRE